ncbi:MAG: peptide chain release factor N(5)-glutamine methyltransferase [Pseudomonadota bacterium]|nr:peptide chain release factor N(5)-glutamine methyltransferase [Pseudomonadota bacterium]
MSLPPAVPEAAEARTILLPAQAQLRDAGIDSAALDARLLLGIALGREDAVLPHETLCDWTQERRRAFAGVLERRLAGEPVSRIRGWREFWSLRFLLSSETLDPRPDSETIVAAALAFAQQRRAAPLRLLDLGSGSGALLLACLSELPAASGVGIDISAGAVETAAANAARLGLDERAAFLEGDFANTGIGGDGFDLILCNPPYIPKAEISALAREVAGFDPHLALDGGDDGLASWRCVMPRIAAELAPGGHAFVEIGAGQQAQVTRIAMAAGLQAVDDAGDMAGIVRCLVFAAAE